MDECEEDDDLGKHVDSPLMISTKAEDSSLLTLKSINRDKEKVMYKKIKFKNRNLNFSN